MNILTVVYYIFEIVITSAISLSHAIMIVGAT